MTLLDKIIQESTLFENLSLESQNNLLNALKIADTKILEKILSTNGEWTKQRLNEIKALINTEITKAYGGLFETIQDEAIEAGAISYASLVGASLPKNVIDEIVNSNRNIQGYTLKELYKLSEENHARQLRTLIASGVSQGLSTEQIVRDFNIKSDKLTKSNIKTNTFTTITESRAIARHSAFKRLEQQGIIVGYEYKAVLDSKTSKYCRTMDSTKFYKSIDEISNKINVHFNCRSVFAPLTENETENKRSSQFGEVDGLSYEEWFLEQPPSFHKATLTNKQYEAFLKGKYKVKSLADITKKQTLKSIRDTLL